MRAMRHSAIPQARDHRRIATPEHRATYQFFPSLPSPIDMLVVTFTLFVCTIRPVDVLVMWV